MRSFAAIPLIAASLASATIYVTAPVASTICNVGTPCPINWNDDGNVPVLATIGPCSIDLCTGGQFAQTCLENISPNTDVSKIASVTLNIDPTVGQAGNYYFIKYTSLAYKDPATPTLPFTAFSAKFTINGMTGTFNSTVLGQISQGTQSQAVVTPAAASSTPAAQPSFLATTKAAAATTAVASKAATTSTAKSGAVGVTVPGVVSSVVVVSFASMLLGFVAFGL